MELWNFVLCIFSRLKIKWSVICKNGRPLNVKSMCAKLVWNERMLEMKILIINDSFSYFGNISNWKQIQDFIWTHAIDQYTRVPYARFHFFSFKYYHCIMINFPWEKDAIYFFEQTQIPFTERWSFPILYKMVMGFFITRKKKKNTFQKDWLIKGRMTSCRRTIGNTP